ncbi:MAG TPA: hypothetical protein VF086_09500 [Propionibacteriaceae bacterium]
MLYRGQCLIHRAEMLYLRGDWDAAADEIEQACRRLAVLPTEVDDGQRVEVT